MMLSSMDEGVLDGYAAINLAPGGWKGVVAGNRYCKEYRETSEAALADAKEMFEGIG